MPKNTAAAIKRRHEAFVVEYIKDFNYTRAYEECGMYKATGRRAQAAASRLITNDNVLKMVAKAVQDRMTRLHLDADIVVLEQLRLGLSDMRNYVEWDDTGVKIKASKDLTNDQAHAIMEITETRTEVNALTTKRSVKFKLFPKQPALDSLMKHLGLYEADNRTKLEHVGVAYLPPAINAESWDMTAQEELNNAKQVGKNDSET